jgi:2,3-bisphosphoglycerate-independent phosphoglycerate mutase
MPRQEQAALEAGACAVLNKAASRAELINKLIEIGTVSMLNDVDVNSEKEADTKQPSSYLYLHRKNCKPEDRLAHLQERKK